jgi:hypothetical protein
MFINAPRHCLLAIAALQAESVKVVIDLRVALSILLLLAALPANADIEIYKCVDADGHIAYQQTPCPVEKEKPEEVELPEQLEESEEEQPSQALVASNLTDEEIEECKEPLRDTIDEIEAEMLRGFSPQESEEFKVKLRTLTQEMRACG